MIVIAPEIFRINPFKNSREEKFVPNKPIKASVRINSITFSQPHVIIEKVINSNLNGLSSTGVDNIAKTRRPQSSSNTKNDSVPSASKRSRIKNKEVEVEEHPRNLLLSKTKKHMSFECNNIKLAIRNVKSKIVCAMCKQCLITANHNVCVLNFMNDVNSHGSKERLASSKPSKPRMCLRWSPIGRFFDLCAELIGSSDSECKSDNSMCNACTSNPQEPIIKRFLHSTFSLGRNLKGVDLLKGNHTTNLYTINLHDMASASPICVMARATSTKSWLWYQSLSHLKFDTRNDIAKNNLVTGLPKFKYHKIHLCSLCEQGQSKRASYPPKPVPNSKQRLHLLHIDLCGPMRIVSINGKRYILVIVDDYSRHTWVYFLRSKDETPKVIKTFLKRITILLQSHVIIVRTDNVAEFKNQVLKEYFDSVGISHQSSFVRTPRQNGVVECRNRTLVEAARTMLIFSHAPLFLWVEAIASACYTQTRSIIYRRFNKHHTSSLMAENRISPSFMYSGLFVIPKMIVKILGSLVQKVILASSLVTLLIPVLT
nr:putative ribonuclease H-like domain-containing protein [Tanacetum cinerariifolium]